MNLYLFLLRFSSNTVKNTPARDMVRDGNFIKPFYLLNSYCFKYQHSQTAVYVSVIGLLKNLGQKELRNLPFIRYFAHNNTRCDGVYPPLTPPRATEKNWVTIIQRFFGGGEGGREKFQFLLFEKYVFEWKMHYFVQHCGSLLYKLVSTITIHQLWHRHFFQWITFHLHCFCRVTSAWMTFGQGLWLTVSHTNRSKSEALRNLIYPSSMHCNAIV